MQQRNSGDLVSPVPSKLGGCGWADGPMGDKRRNGSLPHPVCAAFPEWGLADFVGTWIQVAL